MFLLTQEDIYLVLTGLEAFYYIHPMCRVMITWHSDRYLKALLFMFFYVHFSNYNVMTFKIPWKSVSSVFDLSKEKMIKNTLAVCTRNM